MCSKNVMVGRHNRTHWEFFGCGLRFLGQRREERAIRKAALARLEYVGLAHLAGREKLESILVGGICDGRSYSAAASSFSITERALFEARDLCRCGREKTAVDQILHYCPERVSAARLVEGLKVDAKTHTLVLLARRDSEDLQHVDPAIAKSEDGRIMGTLNPLFVDGNEPFTFRRVRR
jgi:hypothetical protein